MVANQVYQALNLMMTREVEPAAAITLSCGALQAGTVPNTLPDTADLKFGLRSLNVAAREHVLSRIPELVEGYVKAWELRNRDVQLSKRGDRPALGVRAATGVCGGGWLGACMQGQAHGGNGRF